LIKKIVIIGASTGGPSHIQHIISSFGVFQDSVVLIAQHIGAEYIKSFVSQLQNRSQMPIHAIDQDTELKEGNMYVLSGQCSLSETLRGHLKINYIKKSQTYNPDINYIFNSVAALCSNYKVLSIVLTGIGSDGAQGSQAISLNGGHCIAESEKSAIIYGMPLRTKELNPNIQVEDLQNMAKIIMEFAA